MNRIQWDNIAWAVLIFIGLLGLALLMTSCAVYVGEP